MSAKCEVDLMSGSRDRDRQIFRPFIVRCESSETDSDEIISAKSLLMTAANISSDSHRRRCVIAETFAK